MKISALGTEQRRAAYLLPNLFTTAALVAGLIWAAEDNAIDPESLRWWVWGVPLFAGVTMVSKVPYWSFKAVNLRRSAPLLALVALGTALALQLHRPALVLFAAFAAYALSGYTGVAWNAWKRHRTWSRS